MRGFTLVEILIIVCICALLAGIAFPNLIRAKEMARHGKHYHYQPQQQEEGKCKCSE